MCGARPPTLQHYHGMNVMHRDKSIPFWKLCIKYNLTSKHTNSLHDTCVICTDSPTYNYNEHLLAVCYLNWINTQRIAFLAGYIASQLPGHVWQWLRGQINWRRLWAGNHFLKSMSFVSLTLLWRDSKLNNCGLVSVVTGLLMFSGSTRHLVLQNEYNTLTAFAFLCQMVHVGAVLDTECPWMKGPQLHTSS